MGMYLHITVSPTTDMKWSKAEVWANFVDVQGKPHTFTVFSEEIESKEYSEGRPIEAWVIATLSNMAMDVTRAMTRGMTVGPRLLIPSGSQQQIS